MNIEVKDQIENIEVYSRLFIRPYTRKTFYL
jgi:hypothetical protein